MAKGQLRIGHPLCELGTAGEKKEKECVTNAAVSPARQNDPLAVPRLSVVTFPAGISKYRAIALPQSTSPNISGQPGQLG